VICGCPDLLNFSRLKAGLECCIAYQWRHTRLIRKIVAVSVKPDSIDAIDIDGLSPEYELEALTAVQCDC
jgi:hypothetical protein